MSRSAVCMSLLLAVGLAGGTSVNALAQDPTSGTQPTLEYTSPDGGAAGTITVRDLADPFTDFRPDSPPAPDQRYVLLIVRFQAADDKPFNAEASRIVLQDDSGSIWTPTPVNRPVDALPPDLVDQGLAPGDRVSGVIGYVLPKDAVIDEIFYSPTPPEDQDVLYRPTSGSRLLPLLDQHPNPVPALGTAVSDVSPEGRLAGQITVRGVTDPYAPVVAGSPPAGSPAAGGPPSPAGTTLGADQRYVLVDVVFEAAIDKVFMAAPQFIVLHDSDGYQYGHAEVPLAPGDATRELKEHTLSPDDRVSGVVGFIVPADAVIDEVIYEPPYAVRRIALADLTGGK